MEQESPHNQTTNDNSIHFEENSEEQELVTEDRSKFNVIQTRINNELKNLNIMGIDYKYDEKRKLLLIIDKLSNITIDLSDQFPFEAPKIIIDIKDQINHFCLFDFNFASFEDVMKEHWHPSIKIVDIVDKSIEFVRKNLILIDEVPNKLTRLIHRLASHNKQPLFKIFFVIFILRLACAIGVSFLDSFAGESCFGISHQIQEIRIVSNMTIDAYYKLNHTESPLHLLVQNGLGILISAFDSNLLLQTLMLRLVSSIIEQLFIFLPIALLINSLYQQNSKAFRFSIICLIAMNPQILMLTIINANIPATLYIGLLLISLWLLLENQFEISSAFFGLALGMNQLQIWLVPLYWVLLLYKLFREQLFSGGGMNQFDFTQINTLFNRLSTIIMVFMVVILGSWVQIITQLDGISLLQTVSSRLYLENYKQIENFYIITGNQWSLTKMIKNGNLVSLILFGLCNMLSLVSVRSLTKKKFVKSILMIIMSISIFGIVFSRLHILHTLIIILMGVLFNEFQQFFTIFTLLYPLSYIPTDQQSGQSHLFLLFYQIAYQSLAIQFYNMLEYVIQRSKSKKTAESDEELNKKPKGIINQYFRVQGASSHFSLYKNSSYGSMLQKLNHYFHFIAFVVFIVVNTTAIWRSMATLVNGVVFAFNIILYSYILMGEYQTNKTQPHVCNHNHDHGSHHHHHQPSRENAGLGLDSKAKES